MRRFSTLFRKRRPVELPTGTLTFVLTDIEGSTRLWEREPEGMERAVQRHVEIIERAVERHGGVLVRERGEGDSTFSVFVEASAAVRAVLEAQRALRAEPWPAGADIHVRVALHTGEARHADGEYTASAINRCARIRALGAGGQTLISERTADLVRDAMPDGAFLQDLGTHRLRDLTKPERIAQLGHPDLQAAFPALRSLDVRPHNLPLQLTSFIGRDEELSRIRKMLSMTRMLTLTGTGGLGKTRMALQLAADVMDQYTDGVWFVDLAPITDEALVAHTAVAALSLRDEAGRTAIGSLIDHLRDQQALLVLDNCEHVANAAEQLSTAVLRACPEVSIVATSRVILDVPGATTSDVPPMELPSGDPSTEELVQYESVRLFCERAGLRNPDFALSHDNARHVLEICRRLDGLPLAVELAAAQTNVLSPEEIARRLDDRFKLLNTGGGGDEPRHSTLRATLDWSYGLLGAAERLLLGRLSVFVGGCSLDAIEAVCSGDGLAKDAVLDVLRDLVNSSLVLNMESAHETRFTMLETVREYAIETRRTAGDIHATEDRHFAWFLELVRSADLEGPDEAVVLDRLEREHDNFRAALARATPQDGLALAAALGPFWDRRGHWAEGRRWLEGLIENTDGSVSEVVAAAVGQAGRLAHRQGDLSVARGLLERALEMRRQGNDPRPVAWALLSLGPVLDEQGNRNAALGAYEEAGEIGDASGDDAIRRAALNTLAVSAARSGDYGRAAQMFDDLVTVLRRQQTRTLLADPLFNLAICKMSLDDLAGAEAALEEVRAIARDVGDRQLEAQSLGALGDVAEDQLDFGRATALYERSLHIQGDLEDKVGRANSLMRLGALCRYRRESERARDLLEQSLALLRELGFTDGIASTLIHLGALSRETARPEEATVHLIEALSISASLQRKRFIAVCLEVLAGIALDRGDAMRAGRLFGAAQRLRDEMRVPVAPAERASYDRDLDALASALGPRTASVLADGRSLSTEAAVAMAAER